MQTLPKPRRLTPSDAQYMAHPWLVVGLGNPGPEYSATRHNVGFSVVDAVAEGHGVTLARHKRGHARAGEGRIEGHHVVLVEPLSFMNESGGPVKAIMSFYRTPLDKMVVVHDELDLPFGTIRVKQGGGDNGHNGLKSLRSSLGTGDFFRVRIGIGRPPGRQDPAEYVLRGFGSTERRELTQVVERATECITSLIVYGLDSTQNQFNGAHTEG